MADYDEVLPERATVPCETCNMTADGVHKITPAPAYWQCPDCGGVRFRPARAGDTIEVACPECYGGWVPMVGPCLRCGAPDLPRGSGTLRVLLTEDPRALSEFGKDEIVAWRHVGTVVSDA